MKKMKLKGKLVCCFLIAAVVVGLPIILSLHRMRVAEDEFNNIINQYGFIQGDIGNAMLALSQYNSMLHDSLSYENEAHIKELLDGRKNELKKYNKYIEKSKKNILDKKMVERYEEAVKSTNEYIDKSNEIIERCSKLDTTVDEDYAKIEKMLFEELNPTFESAWEIWSSLLEDLVKRGNEESAYISNKNTKIYNVLIIISCTSDIICIIIALMLAKKIAKPIKESVDRIEALAEEGDLHSPIKIINSHDEVGDLSRALNKLVSNIGNIIKDEHYILGNMAEGNFDVSSQDEDSYTGDFTEILKSLEKIKEELSDTLTEIDVASEQVSIGAEQVASGAQELAQGATEQASAIEQINATIATIAKQIKRNAENAKKASDIALTSSKEVEDGNKKMNEMIVAMTEITETSNKIAKIIKTIDDIAFQTNILALNAAVEAARAGEAGKGFAVVADEVRNLAGKSAEAARNTTQLIENSINAVENGTRIADMTAEALGNMVEATNKSTVLINEIAVASVEQANSVEEATKGLEQISNVVQTNSATSEESAAASEELSAQAHKMRQLISHFVLKR